jgi:hypothetical protein
MLVLSWFYVGFILKLSLLQLRIRRGLPLDGGMIGKGGKREGIVMGFD